MKEKVFISGSISIKKLPKEVLKSIDKIISQEFEILIGDANGVDKLVQYYCLEKQYFNVTVYSIFDKPRNKASEKFGFKKILVDPTIKKEVEKQKQKDEAMTKDCNYCLIIWDGKSKGSYSNILRAIELKKKTKVFLTPKNKFLELKKINKKEIEYIFRENNGYSASEVIEYLRKNLSCEIEAIEWLHSNKRIPYRFKSSSDLYKYLVDKKLLEKKNNIYIPVDVYSEKFIIEKYKGKPKGVRFTNKFIDWMENELKIISRKIQSGQPTLFQKDT
ncbi:MAG: hypothetical protein J7K36_02985 [Archaeoglobaceae archaeon]|nr:hypothetical protein [Archaeoglobaceae archaeon]